MVILTVLDLCSCRSRLLYLLAVQGLAQEVLVQGEFFEPCYGAFEGSPPPIRALKLPFAMRVLFGTSEQFMAVVTDICGII